jgi:hypothetical protein
MSILKPKVLLLGTFHMRPTGDMYQTELDDLLSSKRQQEICEVVERVKKFTPTKVAVEVVVENSDELYESYNKFKKGSFKLGVNEVHQLGF